jgi:hypothetical protein
MQKRAIKRRFRTEIVGALLCALCCTSWVVACQVPVFRYAFERWLADKYEFIVLHDGPLNEQDRANFEKLRTTVDESTNAVVSAIDISQSKAPEHAVLWEKRNKIGVSDAKSVMAILYPQGAQDIPDRLLDLVPLGEDSAKAIVDSPVRAEVVKRLSHGQSAVWLFVPIGQPEKDKAALEMLNEQLRLCQQNLKLPVVEDFDVESVEAQEQINRLKIQFSVVVLNREDKAERYLLKMLLGSESDLEMTAEPMAFPVFGRGRVLYALIGKGINGEMVRQACQFMVGPCSCQVKAQNPGFDLLTRLDWELAVGDVKISDPLPETDSEPVLLQIPRGQKANGKASTSLSAPSVQDRP